MSDVKKVKRKDWVKNAAIIFLSVMLVLTFFSNTIMNYSLPEVATAMVEPGSITAKIRGTGSLTSDDPYKISIQETRTISSVAVKEGDVVEKDQVLFYLEDKESEELDKAEQELNDLILAYTTTILNGEISNEAYQNIQNGNISSTAAYQARIAEAKQRVENAQATVDSLTKQIEIAGTTTSSQIDKKAQLEKAQIELANAEAKRTEAKANLEAAKANAESISDLQAKYNNAVMDEGMKKTAYDTAIKYFYNKLSNDKDVDISSNPDYAGESTFAAAFENIINDPDKMNQLTQYVIEADKANDVSANDIYTKETGQALTALQAAYADYNAAKATSNSTKAELDGKQSLSNVAGYQQAYNSAESSYQSWKETYNNLQNELNSNTANTSKQESALKLQLTEADAALKKEQENLTQLLTDVGSELDLGNQNSIIREKREEIAKLREKATGATITAPVAGIVTNVNKMAGETTMPDEELAVMQPEGKGYSMSFSVTAEQAKKVTVGEVAEIQNSWFYNDITATLTAIRPDPENPGQNKLLVFNVAGDVQAGQTLSLSIGQKSANYDLLVPNSAIREDNNGKFILIVEAKNSPLGNRYIANRVDVEVLGSDDVKTAISAPIYGYEYVITTSTLPVEAGQQVRLAEN